METVSKNQAISKVAPGRNGTTQRDNPVPLQSHQERDTPYKGCPSPAVRCGETNTQPDNGCPSPDAKFWEGLEREVEREFGTVRKTALGPSCGGP